MKVIHLNQHLAPRGGVETYLLAALPLLREQGHTLRWLYAEGDGRLWPESRLWGGLGNIDGRDAGQLAPILAEESPDVIHIHNVQHAGIVEQCLAYGPTVLTSHDYRWICPANTFFFKRSKGVCGKACGNLGCFTTTLQKHCLTPRPHYALPFYRRVQQMQQQKDGLAKAIAPSPVARQRLVRSGWNPADVEVLPYFCPLPARAEPRPLPPRPTITFIGRIAPNKGQEYFIEALGRLPEDWQGIMAGSIGEKEQKSLDGLAHRYGCSGRIHFRPWASREEVLQLMDETTVFVFPSLWEETLGIVALEALSRGVPVVASDITGISDYLRNTRFGRLAPPKDAAAIAEGVLELASSQEQLLKAGQAGIDLIRKVFSPEKHVEELIRIYEEAIENK